MTSNRDDAIDAAAGVDAALVRLRDLHAGPLWRYVVSLTGSTADADDVVQETLIRAWRHDSLLKDPPEAVRGWLFTVARNQVVDRARRAGRRPERPLSDRDDVLLSAQDDAVLDAMLLRDAIASLSEQHREVIVRAYYGGHSVAQLSEVLGVAEGTVKSRLHYGMRALRLAFQERGITR